MLSKKGRLFLFAWLLFWSIGLLAEIKLGPVLHAPPRNDAQAPWEVTALYGFYDTYIIPPLVYKDGDKTFVSQGTTIASILGHTFVRYSMKLELGDSERGVSYSLFRLEKMGHKFFVPSKHSTRTLYTSCNGMQYRKDYEALGGIAPNWKKIALEHNKRPYHLQIGGGDQIYADGISLDPNSGIDPADGDTFGIFALPVMRSWHADPATLLSKKFTYIEEDQVKRFYLMQYLNHFNQPGYKEMLASIPSINIADDHDHYDGCGSYKDPLQNCSYLASTRSIAEDFIFSIQHQLSDDERPKAMNGRKKGLHVMNVVDDGKTVYLSIDTRTERSYSQIVSQESWDEIFTMLNTVSDKTKHLLVLVAIPIVYPPSAPLNQAVDAIGNIPLVGKRLLRIIPGGLNEFGESQLADDFKDGWSCHPKERDLFVTRLQDFANKRNVRVTLVSGDVHLAGAGKIYQEDLGFEDCSKCAIYQLISSPVGNAPVNWVQAKGMGYMGTFEQDVGDKCKMCLFYLQRENGDVAPDALVSQRNFLSLQVDAHDNLHAKWTTENDDQNFFVLDIAPTTN